jgi:hypothetical protein
VTLKIHREPNHTNITNDMNEGVLYSIIKNKGSMAFEKLFDVISGDFEGVELPWTTLRHHEICCAL